MLLVILGAGASYDSIDPQRTSRRRPDHRPPLASQLFDDRKNFGDAINRFPQVRPLVARLAAIAQDPDLLLERELQRLQDEREEDERRHQQLAALRFYLQETTFGCGSTWQQLAFGTTNYSALVDRIEHWRRTANGEVVYVTFNYDRMLEDAAREPVGFAPQTIEDYVAGAAFRLIKPHGSANWGRVVLDESRGVDRAADMIERAATLTISGEYVVTTAPTPVAEDGRLLFPAIAIPVETKSEFECPDAHLKFLKEKLRDVTKILTIGWRGTEQHFLQLLSEHLGVSAPNIHIVAGDAQMAEQTARNIRLGGLPQSNCWPSGHTFSSFVGSEEFATFLA